MTEASGQTVVSPAKVPFLRMAAVARGRDGRAARQERIATQEGAVAIVAEGSGGHASGGVAAEIACDLLALTAFPTPFSPAGQELYARIDRLADEERRNERLLQHIEAGVHAANAAVRRAWEVHRIYQGMVAAFAACWSCRDKVVLGHVGDVRIYRVHPSSGLVKCLTEDQTLAGSPFLTNALGGDHLHVALQVLRVEEGDTFLSCTSGIHRVLSDVDIADVLGSAGELSFAAERLVECARARGADSAACAVLRLE